MQKFGFNEHCALCDASAMDKTLVFIRQLHVNPFNNMTLYAVATENALLCKRCFYFGNFIAAFCFLFFKSIVLMILIHWR